MRKNERNNFEKNENGSEQYESSRFPSVEVVLNMEGYPYMETA